MTRVLIRCGWCLRDRTLWADGYVAPNDPCPPALVEELRHADRCPHCFMGYSRGMAQIQIEEMPAELEPYATLDQRPDRWRDAARLVVQNLLTRPRRNVGSSE